MVSALMSHEPCSGMPGDFRKLKVWEKAHALAIRIDRVAVSIRGSRHASLRSQLTRAAMSILQTLPKAGDKIQSATLHASFVIA